MGIKKNIMIIIIIGFFFSCNHYNETLENSNNEQRVIVKKFPNNDIYIIETYNEKVLDGPVIGFFENRRVNISGNYKNGKRNGLWLFFDQQGVLIKKIEFKNDRPIKIWKKER